MSKVTNADLVAVLGSIAAGQNAILEALKGGGQSAPFNASAVSQSNGKPLPPTAAELENQLADIREVQKPVTPLLASMGHPCDNSKRKVKMTVKDRNGKETQEEKNLLLRDETRQVVYPLLQQQIPLIQLQVVVNGKATGHFVNLKCNKSNCGNIQYSTEKTSIPLTLLDANGQHATVDVGTPAGIYFQANQVTAYPKS